MSGSTSWRDSVVIAAFLTSAIGAIGGGWAYINSEADRNAASNKQTTEVYVSAERAYFEASRENCKSITNIIQDEKPNPNFTIEQQERLSININKALESCRLSPPTPPLLLGQSTPSYPSETIVSDNIPGGKNAR